MKNLLTILTTALILAWATAGWAQPQIDLGDSLAAGGNSLVGEDEGWWLMLESPYTHTATAGDAITKLRIRTRAIDSIIVAVYKYNTAADTPTTRYWIDTLDTDSASAWYGPTNLNISLNAGETYSLAFCMIASYAGGSPAVVNDGVGVTNYAQYDAGSLMEDPYSSLGNLNSSGHVLYYATVTNTPPAGSALVVGGGVTLGGGVVVGGK